MRSLLRVLIMMACLTALGTVWFKCVSGWSLVDSIFMTAITLSSVGFGEVNPLTAADKIFVCGFLAMGLGVFLYGVIQVGESVVRAELGQWWRHRNMSGTINALEHHFIVCGAGRMGRLLCEHLADREIPFVAVDVNPDVIETYKERGWVAICADATEDETLLEAGIERAAGMAATLASDADNLFVVMSARLVNPDVRIVARAHDDASGRKLERAGANRIVSPFESAAVKMGQLLTNPRLNDFFEIISDHNLAFDLVGVPIDESSLMVGQSLIETDLRQRGVMIVAIRRADGNVLLAPKGTTHIEAGDELFALGDTQAVKDMH